MLAVEVLISFNRLFVRGGEGAQLGVSHIYYYYCYFEFIFWGEGGRGVRGREAAESFWFVLELKGDWLVVERAGVILGEVATGGRGTGACFCSVFVEVGDRERTVVDMHLYIAQTRRKS